MKIPTLALNLAAIATFALAAASPEIVAAADAPADAKAKSSYARERADCEAGKTAQDRATCLKEAGAAQVERKRNSLDNAGSAKENAVDRCKALPAKDQADCVARAGGTTMGNQTTTTSGSVAGGGVIKETKTVTQGTVTIVPPPAGAASKP